MHLSLISLSSLSHSRAACMYRIVSLRQYSIQHTEYQLTIHEADQSLHKVVHELERASLLAVAVDSDVLPLQRLFSEYDM